MSHWFAGMMDISRAIACSIACLFITGVGGVVATFATLVSGGAVVIRQRFRVRLLARRARRRCTLFQYIGELCRYLSTRRTRPSRLNTRCEWRAAMVRPEVWQPSKTRFSNSAHSRVLPSTKAIFPCTTARDSRRHRANTRRFCQAACPPVAVAAIRSRNIEPRRQFARVVRALPAQ